MKSIDKRLSRLEVLNPKPDENFFVMRLLREDGYKGETLTPGDALQQLVESFRSEFPPENYQPPEI